jgi:hypothetical protein
VIDGLGRGSEIGNDRETTIAAGSDDGYHDLTEKKKNFDFENFYFVIKNE